jgi:hypothetical protein
LTVTPTPPPSYKQEPKPYYKPELPPLNEVRTTAVDNRGTGRDNNNNSDSNINSNKPESAKTVKAGNIKEDAEKEPVIQAILDIFDGEVLNRK